MQEWHSPSNSVKILQAGAECLSPVLPFSRKEKNAVNSTFDWLSTLVWELSDPGAMPWAMCNTSVSNMIFEMFSLHFITANFWALLSGLAYNKIYQDLQVLVKAHHFHGCHSPKFSAIRHWASRRWKRHHRDFGTPPESRCAVIPWTRDLPGISQDTSPILANFPVVFTFMVSHASVRYMNICYTNQYNVYTYYYSKLSSLFSQDLRTLHFRHPSLYTIVLYEIGHWWNACPATTKLDQPSELGSFHGHQKSRQRRESKWIKDIFNTLQQKGSNIHTYTNYV